MVASCVTKKSSVQRFQEKHIDPNNPNAVEHYGRGSMIQELSQEARSFPSSSTEDLMILFKKENNLLSHIRKVKLMLNKLLVDLKRRSKKTKGSYSSYYYSQDDMEDYQEEVEDYFPNENEFVIGAGVGLVQIQAFYQLNASNIASGRIMHFPRTHQLNTQDCLFLARSAESVGRIDKKISWMETALKTVTDKRVFENLSNQIQKEKVAHDNHVIEHGFMKYTPSELGGTVITVEEEPFNKDVKENSKYRKHKEYYQSTNITSDFMYKNNPNPMGENANPSNFFLKINFHNRKLAPAHCMGTTQRPPDMDKDMKCLFLTHNTPLLRLGPFQLEQHNAAPFIGKIHNFVTEKEANWVMDRTRGKMKPTPLTVDGELKKFTLRRISKINFIPDEPDTASDAITRRMMLATRWRLDRPFSQENYQVMNYGPGGSINYHLDQTDEELLPEVEQHQNRNRGGARLATAMVYLTSPLSGGRTVFPQLDISVAPSARSLLFWHNLTPSSKPDTRALHMACPVVYGNKWIMNKWVKWLAHWDSYTCSRTQDHQGAFRKWDV